MRFSLKWLGDFIETRSFFEEPQKLADRLTEAGIEVDSFEDQKSRFDNIKVAKILSVKKHPQADRLTLCQVSTSRDETKTLDIVCGAKNHKAGDKVVLALPGAVLPNGLKIKKSRIRGENSEGMLASKEELDLKETEKEEGIWILPSSAPVGESLAKYKKWDDILLEIAVPPNRSDVLSHRGLAREISSLFSISLKKERAKKSFLKTDSKLDAQCKVTLNSKSPFSIEVQDETACPRYSACLIEAVTVKDSPAWLKQKLSSLGLKSINNVVDITNFILWNEGQPLHAFDRDKIQGIEVALAKKEELFLGLDEIQYKLYPGDLTIRDKKGVLALAGIMGGLDSSITHQTQNIVIESAYFAPERIRKSSRRLGLETDSSYRFTRGIDKEHVFVSLQKACFLIQDLAGGTLQNFYDFNPSLEKRSSIHIALSELSSRLAYEVPAKRFEKQMENISCVIDSQKTKSGVELYEISPPSHRSDLKIKEDLIEEFARLEGYDKIPENTPPVFFPKLESDQNFLQFQKITNYLSSRSWLESLHYSFCDFEYYKEFLNSRFYLEDLLDSSADSSSSDSLFQKKPSQLKGQKTPEHLKDGNNADLINENGTKQIFSVNNPISQKLSLMKPLLTPDLFKTLIQNFRKNNKQGQLFELSSIFYRQEESYQQDWHLAMVIWGEVLDIWTSPSIPNFYKLKEELEVFSKVINTPLKMEVPQNSSLSFLHPKKSLSISYQKRKLGFIGVLHPSLQEKYKIPTEVALAELDLSFLESTKQKDFRFKPFSKLLRVEKDLCFIVPENLPVQKVRKEIESSLSSVCDNVSIFDIYKKEGQRFVSFRLSLSPDKKSWTDDELLAFLEKVIKALDQKFSIKLKP